MQKRVVMDVFQLEILVPADVPPKSTSAIRRTLNSEKFRKQLVDAGTEICRHFPSLAAVRVRVSQ